MRITRARLVCTSAVAALTLTACGGPPTAAPDASGGEQAEGEAQSVFAEKMELSGQERRDDLLACAQEEGGLDLYTSMNSEVANPVVEAFTDDTDVDVSLYRAGSETVLQRVLQESGAGFAGNDVVETNATELLSLNQEGLLAEYQGERRDLVPEAGQFENWTATRFNLFAPSWNTASIGSLGGPPTSWEELADPRFDGQLALEVSDYDWYLTLYGYWQEQGKTDEEIDRLFAEMADGGKVVKGHAVMTELQSAGEYAVAASPYTYLVDRLSTQGAPIEWQPPVEPVIARPNGVALMKTATHPCAALLFTDWILEEGQAVIAEEQLTPAIAQGADPLKDVELIPVDVEKLLNESEEWSARYEKVISAGEQVQE